MYSVCGSYGGEIPKNGAIFKDRQFVKNKEGRRRAGLIEMLINYTLGSRAERVYVKCPR